MSRSINSVTAVLVSLSACSGGWCAGVGGLLLYYSQQQMPPTPQKDTRLTPLLFPLGVMSLCVDLRPQMFN